MATSSARDGRSLGSLAACLSLILCASSAHGGDWTVKTNLSQTLSANDNEDFDVDPEGYTFGSNSRLTVDALAQSHLYEFILNGGLGYQTYFGNAADIPGDRFLPSLATSYLRKGKTSSFNVGASYIVEPNTNDGLQSDTETGYRQNASVNTTVAHKINARNDVSISATASRVDFIQGGEDDEPNSSVGASVIWSHQATKRTGFTLSSGVNGYVYENDENQRNLYSFLSAGASSQLSKRLSVTGSLGVNLTNTYRDELPPDSGQSRDTNLGALADFGFTYLHKDGSLTGSASYGIAPDDDGNLENSLNLALGYSYRISDQSQFQIGVRYNLSDSLEDSDPLSSTFSIQPSYTYTLARDWQLSANYQFAIQNDDAGDDDGIAIQNSVFLTLSRSYVLLP